MTVMPRKVFAELSKVSINLNGLAFHIWSARTVPTKRAFGALTGTKFPDAFDGKKHWQSPRLMPCWRRTMQTTWLTMGLKSITFTLRVKWLSQASVMLWIICFAIKLILISNLLRAQLRKQTCPHMKNDIRQQRKRSAYIVHRPWHKQRSVVYLSYVCIVK